MHNVKHPVITRLQHKVREQILAHTLSCSLLADLCPSAILVRIVCKTAHYCIATALSAVCDIASLYFGKYYEGRRELQVP